ncbi:sensor N-terminal transmembrane domain-containing protein [Aestuariibius sp. 2305UL40-4]|uniref:sensor N-terminal transmembrane domain-containing protein n=1 Tax=Aestuariibius violaceus TaxID=3234132 RepID=UPI00345EF3F8
MAVAEDIDVRDLKSVRDAAEKIERQRARDPEIVIGDEYLTPISREGKARGRRKFIRLKRSPLARKIITFNLMALVLLLAGVLYLNPARDSLAAQRANALVTEAKLVADVYEATLGQLDLATDDASRILRQLELRTGTDIMVLNAAGAVIATTKDSPSGQVGPVVGLEETGSGTVVTDLLSLIWDGLARLSNLNAPEPTQVNVIAIARELHPLAMTGVTQVKTARDREGGTIFTVVSPVFDNGTPVATVAVVSAAGEIDGLVRQEREDVLQMFVLGIVVSIFLSLALASTIANPISDLAAAAEIGHEKNARKMSPHRVRIPDLTARPDEIGRLSGALRGMVSALYERIEGNEQFAADVAHEIKNPLASLRSAVGTLRLANRDDQRERLLDVIEHDVRRLDRLVSDISNASRLDSELVKEEEEAFDILNMLTNLTSFLSEEAHKKEIDFITDMPNRPIHVSGLEARLAQVFVNLITNAISFCEAGDAIRIWVRKRDNRVLVVVEDTGPGIPESALTKIFQRFYSERPEKQFGNNSGLGLAISKQIVEAHGGVIWAENIRPTDADPDSAPLGARFVVGLPV